MIKNKDILIRIDNENKQKIKEKASQKGLSVSSYVRTLIFKDLFE